MVAATFRSFVGVAKEVTPGTGVAPADYIPVNDDPEPKDNIDYLDDDGWRGSMVKTYGLVKGVQSGEISLKGNVDIPTIGYPLASILPDVVTVGAGDPFTHTFAVKNTTDGQPVSYSITDFDGFEARRYRASKCEELTFKFDADGLLEYEAKFLSYASETVATPVPSFPANERPIANWTCVANIGGVASLIISSGEVTIKREVSLLHTMDGTGDPYKLFSGAVEVEGKLTVIHEDAAEITRYINNTQPALDLKWQATTGPGDSLQLVMTKAGYTAANIGRGEEYGEIEIEFRAVANTTDIGASAGFSPIKAVLVNAKPASTYV